MNILIASWTWFPSGGEWTYIENMIDLYEKKGHRVIPFSMKDERNRSTEYSEFFIENIDYKAINNNRTLGGAVKVLQKSMYSTEAVRNLERLLKTVKIDLAHLNLLHHFITPSILKVLKKHNIPVIWTLHDYTILCPQGTFISHDEVCERCKGGKFYNVALHRCKRNSFLASALAGMENYIYSYLDYYGYVDHYICPSVFSYEKYKSYGFFPEKLVQIYHSYKADIPEKTVANPTEPYVLYVGRLEKIKGVHTLLEAMRSHPDIKLKIIGYGTQEEELKLLKNSLKLEQVEFMGKRSQKEVLQIMQDAAFMVCPSEWYEVLGFTIVEAMLMGKPVIGARIGAIPESVLDGRTGLLFEPGNAAELSEKIGLLFKERAMQEEMGANARRHMLAMTDTETHYTNLKKIIPGL